MATPLRTLLIPKTMARPSAADPLVLLPCRIPASVVERLQLEADANGSTLSDALRSHLTLDAAKPLGKPRPRKRDLGSRGVSKADPALLRQLAAIGNNCNQIARQINSTAISGQQVDLISALNELRKIQNHLRFLAN